LLTDHTTDLGIRVLSAGYAFHNKPYHGKNEPRHNYLIRIQTEGLSRTWIDGQYELLEPGDLLIIHPDDYYELLINEEDHQGERKIESGDYYIFFTGPWVQAWWQERKRPFRVRTPLEEGIVQLCRLSVIEHRRKSEDSPAILDYLMRVMLLTIDRLITEQRPHMMSSFLAYRIKNFIEENATTNFQLQDIADHFSISISRAVHLYKEVFGKSIMQHALEVRLNLARERIIYTNMPLDVIAETSGFANYTYFHRVFRRQFGLSPKEYRVQNRLI
jgi:AraC family transcriptional regulator of arabinose operon